MNAEKLKLRSYRRSTLISGYLGVPGMALNSSGESPDTRYSQSRRLAKEQGRCREAGSEGSSRQTRGAMNKNPIRGVIHPGPVGT